VWEEHSSPRAPSSRAPSGTDFGTFSQPITSCGLKSARGEADFHEMVNAWPESKRPSLSPSAQSAQSAASTTSPSTPNPAQLAVRRENPVCALRGAALSGPAFAREGGTGCRHLRPAPAPRPHPLVLAYSIHQTDQRTCVHSFFPGPGTLAPGAGASAGALFWKQTPPATLDLPDLEPGRSSIVFSIF